MENIEEIRKTLTFYVLANKLKTTIIDEINNYSVADNIFGSMILAIAMDSEFKETANLGKLFIGLFIFIKVFAYAFLIILELYPLLNINSNGIW